MWRGSPGTGPAMELVDLDLRARPHVYPLREDSLLLASSARVERGERVLEVGCGSGLAALSAARRGARVLASDLNPYALRMVREEAAARGLRVDVARADLFGGLGRFEVVLCNPPYLPSDEDSRESDRWERAAVDGGRDGHVWVARFLRELPEHLRPGGRAYLLVASLPSSPVRKPGLPAPAGGIEVVDLVGDRTLPAETLWVLELAAR